VSEATASRIDDNITSAHFVAPYGSVRRLGSHRGGGNDALFSTFDYKPEQYERPAQLQSELRKQQEQRRLQVNPLPFLYSTPRPLLTNALAGAAPSSAPGEDPFDGSNATASRQAFLEHQGLLHGPFVPSGGARSVGDDRVIRLKLPEILSRLLRALDDDWSDARFTAYVDEDDLILIQFALDSVDNLRGLQSYMNMFVKTSPIVSEFQLAKLPELWHHCPAHDNQQQNQQQQQDGAPSDPNVYYALRPPWVRRRAEASMFALHPELSVAGGTFAAAQKQQALQRLREEKKAQQPTEPLMLTAGSHHNGAVVPAAPSSYGAQTASGGGGSSRHHHPHSHSTASTTTVTAAVLTNEERERMNSMMASFDAGVQPPQQRQSSMQPQSRR
jgi:hypothetical protein